MLDPDPVLKFSSPSVPYSAPHHVGHGSEKPHTCLVFPVPDFLSSWASSPDSHFSRVHMSPLWKRPRPQCGSSEGQSLWRASTESVLVDYSMAPEAASHQDQQKDVGESNKTEVCVFPGSFRACVSVHSITETLQTLHVKNCGDRYKFPLGTWDA